MFFRARPAEMPMGHASSEEEQALASPAERADQPGFWRGPRLAPGPAILIMVALAVALWAGIALLVGWLRT